MQMAMQPPMAAPMSSPPAGWNGSGPGARPPPGSGAPLSDMQGGGPMQHAFGPHGGQMMMPGAPGMPMPGRAQPGGMHGLAMMGGGGYDMGGPPGMGSYPAAGPGYPVGQLGGGPPGQQPNGPLRGPLGPHPALMAPGPLPGQLPPAVPLMFNTGPGQATGPTMGGPGDRELMRGMMGSGGREGLPPGFAPPGAAPAGLLLSGRHTMAGSAPGPHGPMLPMSHQHAGMGPAGDLGMDMGRRGGDMSGMGPGGGGHERERDKLDRERQEPQERDRSNDRGGAREMRPRSRWAQ
ncbi:hypothetical protein V8C86DRAFT_2727438 [Haematococcus lacustris]